MQTTDDSVVEIRPWVDSILKIGELVRALREKTSENDAETCQAELSQLRGQIPSAVNNSRCLRVVFANSLNQ